MNKEEKQQKANEIIKKIEALRAKGMTFTEICDEFIRLGIKTAKGKTIDKKLVSYYAYKGRNALKEAPAKIRKAKMQTLVVPEASASKILMIMTDFETSMKLMKEFAA